MTEYVSTLREEKYIVRVLKKTLKYKDKTQINNKKKNPKFRSTLKIHSTFFSPYNLALKNLLRSILNLQMYIIHC